MNIVVHPAWRQPLKTFCLVVYLVLASWTLGAALLAPMLSISSFAAALAVLAILMLMLRAWFVPTRYRIDDAGIEVRDWRTRHFSWDRFRGWRRERNGFYLSPFSNPARFDNCRGLFIVLGNFVVSSSPCAEGASVDAKFVALLQERIGEPVAPAR